MNEGVTEPQTADTIEERVPTQDIGPRIEGVVETVNTKFVELTLDDGRAAIIRRDSFGLHNESPADIVSVGDRCFGVELDRNDPSGKVVLSRTWALRQDAWAKLEESFKSEKLIKGKVKTVRGQGLVLDFGIEGYLPASHLELDRVEDLASYVGKLLEVKIIEANPKSGKLVVSRRSIAHKERRQRESEAFEALKPGQIVQGRVDSLSQYGAFVKVGEIVGLVHISELSWKDIKKAEDVVSVGDEIEVEVLDVNKGKRRLSLSYKACIHDPASDLEEGKVYGGEVEKLADFGAFISIGSVTGLVHLSELSEYRVSHPSEVVMPGEQVRVKVLDVDLKKRRISLSIRQAAEV